MALIPIFVIAMTFDIAIAFVIAIAVCERAPSTMKAGPQNAIIGLILALDLA